MQNQRKLLNELKRPLLFLDLLGFSNFVMKKGHEELFSFYVRLLSEIDVFNDPVVPIKYELLSDGIFLWVEDADLDRNYKLLVSTASALLHNLLGERPSWGDWSHFVPVRGAICYERYEIGKAEYYLGNKVEQSGQTPIIRPNFTVLGKAIVIATKWERKQEWLGISIPNANLNSIENDLSDSHKQLIDAHYLLEYEVPTKEGNVTTFAVNPISSSLAHKQYKYILSSLIRAKSETMEVNHFRKYVNTERFLKYAHSLGPEESDFRETLRKSYINEKRF